MILSSLIGWNNKFSPNRQNRLRVPSRMLYSVGHQGVYHGGKATEA